MGKKTAVWLTLPFIASPAPCLAYVMDALEFASRHKKLFTCACGMPHALQMEIQPFVSAIVSQSLRLRNETDAEFGMFRLSANQHVRRHISVNNCYLKLKLDKTQPEHAHINVYTCIAHLINWPSIDATKWRLPVRNNRRLPKVLRFSFWVNCCEDRATRNLLPSSI